MDFTSENTAPVHPAVMQAVVDANTGFAPNFENERWTQSALHTLKERFEHDDLVALPVTVGTAANAIAIGALTRPYEAILCHYGSHIRTSECGAPEMYSGGARQITLEGSHGKVDAANLSHVLKTTRFGNVDDVQPAVLSLTNLTEAGTAYSPAELRELASIAHQFGLKVHMDGARFANAVAFHGATPAEMSWKAGIDVLSLGTTKSGTLGAEIIISFNPALKKELAYLRKRGGHLSSKTRFIGAQIQAYFDGDLWLNNARHAHDCATMLARAASTMPHMGVVHPVEGNEVFLRMPDSQADTLIERGFRFHRKWHGQANTHRFVMSWASQAADVQALIAECKALAAAT